MKAPMLKNFLQSVWIIVYQRATSQEFLGGLLWSDVRSEIQPFWTRKNQNCSMRWHKSEPEVLTQWSLLQRRARNHIFWVKKTSSFSNFILWSMNHAFEIVIASRSIFSKRQDLGVDGNLESRGSHDSQYQPNSRTRVSPLTVKVAAFCRTMFTDWWTKVGKHTGGLSKNFLNSLVFAALNFYSSSLQSLQSPSAVHWKTFRLKVFPR